MLLHIVKRKQMSKLLIWLEPLTKITKHIGKNLLYDMISELFIDDSNTMIFKCLLGGWLLINQIYKVVWKQRRK